MNTQVSAVLENTIVFRHKLRSRRCLSAKEEFRVRYSGRYCSATLHGLKPYDFVRGTTVVEAQFQDLIRRVRERDEDAARELTERYERVIRRVVRIHLRDSRIRQVMDSTDVCQSVLASFFVRTALGQYELDTPQQLVNLLTTITRNKLTNQIHQHRAQRRDVRKNTTIESEGVMIADRATDPSEQASAKELLEMVTNRLAPQERYLAEQRSIGRTWPEIAEELGATDVALRKKLTRALDRVMAELGIDEALHA
jgi:RNA polymerase sigma-70 factor (ECF subfamily)